MSTYYQQHKEQALANQKDYYQRHRGERLAYQNKYNKDNHITGAKRLKILRKINPALAKSYSKIYKLQKRARLHSLSDGSVTASALLELRQRSICEYCGVALTPKNRNIDHKQPLCLGGKHSLANLAAACAECNALKGCMAWTEWQATLTVSNQRGMPWTDT
jgi:5-methylcytosine-specific restriction endonuclease McrA